MQIVDLFGMANKMIARSILANRISRKYSYTTMYDLTYAIVACTLIYVTAHRGDA
jgi:hypothetical protein